jgi:hypothetical protein
LGRARPAAQPVGPEGGEVGRELESEIAASQGAGSPLPAETRSRMEARLGADFGQVRVHTGGRSIRLNRQLSAEAFTVGRDIFVGERKPNLTSHDGQRLLAHELVHTIQQGGAKRVPLSRPLATNRLAVQRKFTGDLAGKKPDWVIEQLQGEGYAVKPMHKSRIREMEVVTKEYSSLAEVAQSLRITKGELAPVFTGLPPVKSSEPQSSLPSIGLPGRRTTGIGGDGNCRTEAPNTGRTLPVSREGIVPELERRLARKLTGVEISQVWSQYDTVRSSGVEYESADTVVDKILELIPRLGGPKSKVEPKAEQIGTASWKKTGLGDYKVQAAKGDWTGFGHLELSRVNFTDSGLEFDAKITSNPKLIWEKGDLLSITLPPTREQLGELTLTREDNVAQIVAKYPYETLAKLLGVTESLSGKSAEMKRSALITKKKEIGVLATWRTKEGTGEQHRSGGIDQKGGSGRILLIDKITAEDLAETEYIRNIGWNEGELMKPGRPIYDAFPYLFQFEKEMATTLEAESEYVVSKTAFAQVLTAMEKLAAMDPAERKTEYGIEKMDDVSRKEYLDTYYDIQEEGKAPLYPLLHSNVVFRRRHVETDDPGTNLIAIKGSTYHGPAESGLSNEEIRLAAQINMAYDPSDPKHQEEMRKFLATQGDNAFARVLRDALRQKGREGLLGARYNVTKALTVRSERTKYKLWLANSTMIDFSADKAFGSTGAIKEDPERNVLYSFEFGVGHPGLTASATGTGGIAEEDPKLLEIEKIQHEVTRESRKRDYLTSQKPSLHRPYHTPEDLRYARLFEKDDYKQYMNLRNIIREKLFALSDKPLKGGNKAKVLAQKMGLIEKVD